MTIAVLAEKPSVARDIARVVGARSREQGALRGNGYVVTWAIGHLVSLAEPHQIDPAWRRWSFDQLPMIPQRWPLEPYERTRDQLAVVTRILNAPEVDSIICATDAGREGELIFRLIYEHAGCRKPVERLWISSLTEDAIRAGLAGLRAGAATDALADAARGRSRADWLVGLNLSRAYSLAFDDRFSVGRVQTPTLAMLVERELAIRDFEPQPYAEVLATFRPSPTRPPEERQSPAPALAPGRAPATAEEGVSYLGVYFREPPLVDDAEPASSRVIQEPSKNSKPLPSSSSKPQQQKGISRPNPDEPGDRWRRAQRLPADGELARAIVARARTGRAEIESSEARPQRLPAPRLYDLTELQRHANRLFGFSASRTLEVAQQLYEEKKLLSYPRTDSRHLTQAIAETLPAVVDAIRGRYEERLAPGTGERPLGTRFVDDARVGDHHALLPTATSPERVSLNADQARIYDLVCRRLLAAWHPDHRTSTTTVVTRITNPGEDPATPIVDRYRSTGTRVDAVGWKVLDRPFETLRSRPTTSRPPPRSPYGQDLPSRLEPGTEVEVLDAEAIQKQTRPPPRFTEATLLTAMETAGRQLDDRALSDAMRETGLGTPATRAGIIETLLSREYTRRDGKSLVATDKGIRLIEVVAPEVKSPEMTGSWEARLQAIQRGEDELPAFLRDIERFVGDAVSRVRATQSTMRTTPARRPPIATTHVRGGGSAPPGTDAGASRGPRQAPASPDPGSRSDALRVRRRPTPPEKLQELLQGEFGFERFRPYQEAVCRALTRGEDVLLVMPTGAGKSLCYQLPGLARGGTTLVVSPLIALMEDQTAALQRNGLRAERIHSGRSRPESRAVCNAYLQGELDFLFIAPERLSVPGFPEFLARRPLALIAVDEAHCISQWGHDFRPDYRMLKERLPALRPAPIAALTATATPTVQRDIVEQLGVGEAQRFIHGFRRDNIAIEVVEGTPSGRDAATSRLLADPARRPAIVYAPTRKKADALARRLAGAMPAARYHAGMTAAERDATQRSFLEGRLEVIVATIAFGMGIDKPDVRTVVHTALPASVEGYYQEIGRAGRDGGPSRAILFHGYGDRRTHEWFTDRDYPDVAELRRVFDALPDSPESSAAVQRRCRIDDERFEKALEKLWIHGGAIVTADDRVRRGADRWARPYQEQRRNREEQLTHIARYAERRSCRMVQLVEHFGDQEDDGAPCGRCDVCAPGEAVALRLRPARTEERASLTRILGALRRRGLGVGRLHGEALGDAVERSEFERLLAALVRAGLVSEADDSFERDGEEIRYRRATLTAAGRRANEATLAAVAIEEPEARPAAAGPRAPRPAPRRRRSAPRRPPADPLDSAGTEAAAGLVEALRAWRSAEAQQRRTPPFRVLSNRALVALAADPPASEAELLAIPGIGATRARKYGASLLALLARHHAR